MRDQGTKKIWKDDETKSFVNPYNFASLSGEVIRSKPEPGNLSGKIVCTLTAVTPLAVPDAEKRTEEIIHNKDNNATEAHYNYPFFTAGGKHIIPGSSIRGVVRNMFEAVTNSCFSVNNNNILSARHSFPRKPCILKKDKGNWVLYNAVMTKCDEGTKPKEGQLIRKWYRNNNMYTESFFVFNEGSKVICTNLDKSVEDLKECIKLYKSENENNKKKDKLFDDLLNKIAKGEPVPIFYETVGDNNVYLSPAQISRTVFHNKLNDLLQSHRSCSFGSEEICQSCALFGIIRKQGEPVASRIRFSDAVATDFIECNKWYTLKELSSPKTTSVEFYTQRPIGAKAWNYDYSVTGYETETINGRKTTKRVTQTISDLKIRGRKFYLHDPSCAQTASVSEKTSFETDIKNQRNSTMQLAGIGSKFTFEVYFDCITQDQLQKLVWTLTLSDNNENSDHLYKIGHGKPLGLGSAKIVVNSVIKRTVNMDTMEYKIDTPNVQELINDCPLKMTEELKKLTNLHTADGMRVSYPIAEDTTSRNEKNKFASHQWFLANRSVNSTAVKWDIAKVLPNIKDDDITLPAYKRVTAENAPTPNREPQQYSFGESGGNRIIFRQRGSSGGNKKR